ncbi:MAG: flagellar hook-associated protein FlgK [Deltaproteobacteria bacterium]|nr:flagellar hook-associated protein FlgK [Deltaproteobacteria bacterium]
MGGIGLVLNVAKDALLTQQYAIDVTSHNIANVGTDGYSRQTAVIEAKDAAPYGGFIFGRGVELNDIIRNTNEFIEKRMQSGQSDLSSVTEQCTYMNVLETIFDESSGSSLSSQFDEFWASFNDLANNPSGIPERNILVENAVLLSESFNNLYTDVRKMNDEINNSIETGIDDVNEILTKIADINMQIVAIETSGNANDLRDQRNSLVTELSQYLEVNTYEYDDGNLVVTTGKGYTLVSRGDTYPLTLEGGGIILESSPSARIDITDSIESGKIGGWLDMRDNIIPEVIANLNELAGALIWEVNSIHSQGIGLEGISSLTGTYSVSDPGAALGTEASGLDYYDKIADGAFTLWLYDADGNAVGSADITVDADVMTMSDLATEINDLVIGLDDAFNASASDDRLNIEIDGAYSGYTFAFSNDTSNILAALGVNTFFQGSDSRGIAVNDSVINDKNNIAAARIDADGEFAEGDNTNALAITELQYSDVTIRQWTYGDEGAASEDITNNTLDEYLHMLVSSIGIKSQSLQRTKEYKETIQTELTTARDNISAVSLDEEMTNLIKFQQAYTAAAKLITTADEMLDTLLAVR